MPVRIVTDSTCDLPTETITRYGISVIPLYINFGSRGYLDGVDITREEFYKKLQSSPIHPSTALPSPQKFNSVFDILHDEGATQILSIHISSSLSGVVNVARLAAQDTTATEVTVLDSRQLSLGTGFLVETAAKMAAAGHSVEEILGKLHAQINRSHVFAVLDTLEFLKRSGRMNSFMAGIGSLLQIKPILTMYDGNPGNERVRTREKATSRLYEMLHKVGQIERLAILHADASDRVAELKETIMGLFPNVDLLVAEITPVIGAHIGPGAFGFAAVGEQIQG